MLSRQTPSEDEIPPRPEAHGATGVSPTSVQHSARLSSASVSVPPPPADLWSSAVCRPLSSSSSPHMLVPDTSPSSNMSPTVSPPPPPVSVLGVPHPSAPPPSTAHVPSPCCSCSTLLPRLLSAHRAEVRRLLRGALSSLSRRLDALDRRGQRGRGTPPASRCKRGTRRKGEALSRGDTKRRRTGSGESGRFVGRMAVTLPSGGVDGRLRLQDAPLMEASLTSHDAQLSLELVRGRLHSAPPRPSFSSSRVRVTGLQASCSPGVFPVWRLSAAAVEMLLSVRGGACGHPERPLKDWTAPPSLSSDHSYVLRVKVCSRHTKVTSTFSPTTRRPPKPRANQSACRLTALPERAPGSPSSACSKLADAKVERRKRVSQFRIRRSSPRETQLTPMGLPKMKRLTKKTFSLEEIYTNQNFNHGSPCRSLETIFEEPREKDGSLLLIGHQRRRRLLLFPDFTLPRKRRRATGAGLVAGGALRKRAAPRRSVRSAVDAVDLDVMLVERLSALEDFLLRHELSCD